MPDTRDLTAVIDDSGFPIGWRSMERPPRFVGAPIILARSAVPVVLTGGTAETVMATIQLPGGLMGPDGFVRVHTFWSHTNSAGTKTVRVKLSGVVMFINTPSTTNKSVGVAGWANRGSESSQVQITTDYNSGFGATAAAATTAAVDTRADQPIQITGQLANGADSLTLEAWFVEVFPSE